MTRPQFPRRASAPGAGLLVALTADELRAARLAAGHSQRAAAGLVGVSLSQWQSAEQGRRAPHPAIVTVYLLGTGQHPTERLTRRRPATAQIDPGARLAR